MNRFNYLPNHRYYDNTDGVIPDSNGKALRGYSISGENVGDYDEKSGKYKIPVRVCGKNLFDKDNVTYISGGYFTHNVNPIKSHTGGARTIYVHCKPNTTYTVSRQLNVRINDNGSTTQYVDQLYFACCNEKPIVGTTVYNAVRPNSNDRKSLTIKTTADAKYLVAYIFNPYGHAGYIEEDWIEALKEIQIEENASDCNTGEDIRGASSEYESYNGKTYNILLNEPLNGVLDSTISKSLPVIGTQKGYNNILVTTNNLPTATKWQYYK